MRDTSPSYETNFTIPSTHPAMAGHFPGAPIVPGVLLLDTVLTCAEAWLGGPVKASGLPKAKFMASLLPEEEAVVTLQLTTTHLTFTIRRGDLPIAQGVFSLTPAAASR
jgi:3-hydroxyacyl-[acyl-carrier-protein] dehydratase